MSQITSKILMIRPLAFGFNTETAFSNIFQHPAMDVSDDHIIQAVKKEFDDFVHLLDKEGIRVTVLEDNLLPIKPDAVFPNNWISFHEDGTIITYPLFSHQRREERREDLVNTLNTLFKIKDRVHFETFENDGQYLEGTGSMVLDRINKIAYACISDRTHPELLKKWCQKMGYHPYTFQAVMNGIPVYHTNVMMAIGTKLIIVCLKCITNRNEQLALRKELEANHHVVEISIDQVRSFAGNMLALENKNGEELMVMSTRALESLSANQKKEIEKYCRIVASPIQTIEDIGGGSARCMIAEVFLDPQ